MTPRTERFDEAFVQEALRGTRLERVRWVAETGSTNDDLAKLALEGAPEQVLITDLQTAGRGRRGRVWEAPSRSGVLMSIMVRGIEHVDGFWAVGAVALAASQVIDEQTSSPCTVKWPNDVMLGPADDQRKVAGILSVLVDDAVIVGIGINANWPEDVPAVMVERGTSINRHLPDGESVERSKLAADVLLRAIGHLESDRAILREAWKARCSTLGQLVRLELETGPIVGTAADIAPDGALQIEEDGVRTTHQVGDVVHLRPAT